MNKKIRTKPLPRVMRRSYIIDQVNSRVNLASMKFKNYQDPFNLSSYLGLSPQRFANNITREEIPEDYTISDYPY